MRRLGRNRRRAVSAALLSIALVASIAVFAATSGATETARTIATLEKSCAPGAGGAPVFTIRNVSKGTPVEQTVNVEVYDRHFKVAKGLVLASHEVKAGESYTFTATGWAWKSAVRPDRQYFAFFTAVVPVKKKGNIPQELKTHEFCACKKPTPTTSSTSSTSSTSTTTSSTTTTSTSSTTTTTIRF